MKWIKASERKPKYATPVPYRELMESVEGVNRYWYGQFEIFESQFSIDGELNYEPYYLYKLEWLDESQASDKDKEIERLKGLISKAHRRGFNAGSPHKHYETEKENSAWQLFKTENNL